MAKSVAAACAFLFLLVVSTSIPTASSFQLIPDFLKCWYAVIELKGCSVNIVPSKLDFQIKLTEQCCKAINGIEESCLHVVLSDHTIGSALLNITSKVCAAPPVSLHHLQHKHFNKLN
ncbi:hypothetical protein IEQ34_018044 [Dendrobium chrysotoxum]|uniref:Prolamin-like domain-containing protein n=1 Tax=Dendrobium chrysotoxum TaxID=161865 RepID=A0AAV7FVG9_DENCH|nr:hypothetical protein IEQ34_018044 [Dendrobium chrysotoxum]